MRIVSLELDAFVLIINLTPPLPHLLVQTNIISFFLLSSIIAIMPDNRNKDSCDCVGCCRYPNGPIPLILAQILLFLGLILSIESMIKCKFVIATIESVPKPLPEPLATYLPTDSRRGLGFFFWELENGECSWDLIDDLGHDLSKDLMEDYIDFLGGDWRAPRGMGITALTLSCIIWIWILIFSCVAHLRPVRYVVAAICFILVVFQAVTFAVVTSDFCDDADCKMGRGARFSIGAVFCFFFTGLLFLKMRDHPGDANTAVTVTQVAPAAVGKGVDAHEEANPIDMEEQTVELNEEVLTDWYHRCPRDGSSLPPVC
jgi:hypothetical protein